MSHEFHEMTGAPIVLDDKAFENMRAIQEQFFAGNYMRGIEMFDKMMTRFVPETPEVWEKEKITLGEEKLNSELLEEKVLAVWERYDAVSQFLEESSKVVSGANMSVIRTQAILIQRQLKQEADSFAAKALYEKYIEKKIAES